MAVGELCNREAIFTFPKSSIADAARIMRRHHVGSVVVVDDDNGGRPVGIITDRDIAIGVVALGLDAETILVEGIMRPGVVCIEESDSLTRAVALMRDQGVRRLPVVDERGRLTGLLAADDLLDLFAAEISDLAGVVARGMRREARERVAVSA